MTLPRDTRWGCGARVEIVIHEMDEWVSVKFITKHNHLLLLMLPKSRLHQSHSTIHRKDEDRQLVCSRIGEGIRPSHIARVCNAVGGWPEQNTIARQCGEIVRRDIRNNVSRESQEIVKYFKQRQKEDCNYYFMMDLGLGVPSVVVSRPMNEREPHTFSFF